MSKSPQISLQKIVISFIFLVFVSSTIVNAAVSTWQQSASFYPTSSGDFASNSFKQSLADFASLGGNYVTLIIPYYQSNLSSSSIHAGWNTPSDNTLTTAINYAHSLGLNVMLKPHLDVETGEWRALTNPTDRTAWFTSYGNMITKYAAIAKDTEAAGLTIGAELSNMTNASNPANTASWNNLIGQVRSIYNGQLTYSAQRAGYQGEVNNLGFWSSLDAIGISAYYELAVNESNPSVNSLINSWDHWNQTEILPLYQQYQKPILFTEIGYRSVDGAHLRPWDYSNGGGVNQTEQDNLYQALFSYWNNQSHMIGVHLWDFSTNPNAGGSGDTGYTPQNKLAEQTIKTWFSGSSPTPSPTPSPSPTPPTNSNYQISASTNPTVPNRNQSTTIIENIKTTANLANVIVDIEVYNESNSRVHQQFYQNQNFTANVTKLFQTIWTPLATGVYTIKTGIFSQNWAQLLHWKDQLATVNVTQTTPTPTPTSTPTPTPTPTPTATPTPTPSPIPSPSPTPTPIPSPTPTPTPTPTATPSPQKQIENWWPINNANISGNQPFKALITNLSLLDYKLYWQVDGGVLNEMVDSQQDYPHKEVLVDVSGWQWRGNGPYTINFVGKDNSGNVITQKSITIFTH